MQAKVILLAVFLLSLLTAVPPARSAGVDPQCIDDLDRYCGSIEPGFGRIQKCFDDNINKFSPTCQTQLTEGKADAAAGVSQSRQRRADGTTATTAAGTAATTNGQNPMADAIQTVNEAIVELTDPPGLGKRTTVDLNKRWGSDRSVIDSATAKLQDGLSKARSAGAGAPAIRQLDMAIAYGKAREHKEARLSAQGALRHLCVANNDQGPGCDTAPKYGSYTAP